MKKKSLEDFVPPKSAANYEAHKSALFAPVRHHGHEAAIRDMARSVEFYVVASEREYGSAEDGFLTPYLADILKGLRGLLNGDVGRLDAGSVDSFIMHMADRIGWCLDHDEFSEKCEAKA